MKRVEDLKVPLGAWQPSGPSGQPRWELLAKAPVWTAEQCGGLRAVLSQRKREWTINDSADGVLSVVPVPVGAGTWERPKMEQE